MSPINNTTSTTNDKKDQQAPASNFHSSNATQSSSNVCKRVGETLEDLLQHVQPYTSQGTLTPDHSNPGSVLLDGNFTLPQQGKVIGNYFIRFYNPFRRGVKF